MKLEQAAMEFGPVQMAVIIKRLAALERKNVETLCDEIHAEIETERVKPSYDWMRADTIAVVSP